MEELLQRVLFLRAMGDDRMESCDFFGAVHFFTVAISHIAHNPPFVYQQWKELVAELYRKRCWAHQVTNHYLEASQDFLKAIELDKDCPGLNISECQDFIRNGDIALERGNLHEAELFFLATAKGCPRSRSERPTVHTAEFDEMQILAEIGTEMRAASGLGCAYFKQGKTKKAKQCFENFPHDSDTSVRLDIAEEWKTKGEQEFNQRNFAEANKNFSLSEMICTVLLEAPGHGDFLVKNMLSNVLCRRAVNYFCWKKKQEAVKDRDRCYSLQSGSPNPIERLYSYWQERGETEEKKRHLTEAVEAWQICLFLSEKLKISKDAVRRFQCLLVNAFMTLKKYDQAVEEMSNIVENHNKADKDIAKTWKGHGTTFYKESEHSLAQRVYSFAIGLCPKDDKDLLGQLYSNRSFMNIFLKRYQSAMDDAKKCIEINPRWSKGYFRYGKSLHQLQEFKKAYEQFLRSFDLATTYSEKLDSLKETFKAAAFLENDIARPLPSSVLSMVDSVAKKLYEEGEEDSWKAFAYILSSTSFVNRVNVKYVSLTTVIEKGFGDTLVRVLLERGCDPNGNKSQGNKGLRSPLDVAIEKSQSGIVVLLIKYGAKTNKWVPNVPAQPALHTILRIAIEHGKIDLIQEGIKMLDPTAQDSNGNTILHVLASGSATTNKVLCLELVTEQLLIDPGQRNKQFKRAIDLCTDNIRRRMLMDLEKPSATVKVSNSGKKAKRKKKKKKKGKENVGMKDFNNSNASEVEMDADDEGDLEEAILMENGDGNDGVTEKYEGLIKQQQKSLSVIEEAREEVKRLVTDFDVSNLNLINQMSSVMDKHEALADNPGSKDNDTHRESEEKKDAARCDSVEAERSLISSQMKEEDIDEEDDHFSLDDNIFEGLTWEVECTSEVWKTLKGKKLEPFIKKKIINKIKMLASGDWRPELAIRLEGMSKDKDVRLYEAKLNKGARILWEEAVAFSPRCSMDPELRLQLGRREGRIYTDIIRIWDIAFNHDAVPHMIERIIRSHDRGLQCTIQKRLKGLKRDPLKSQQGSEHIPNFYFDLEEERKQSEIETVNEIEKKDIKGWQQLFFPPASPNNREYHILKFYAFTSAMASSILNVSYQNFDFPFQVSELEHAVINLGKDMKCALLLLGRSGTGKTTCCLYRMWRHFQLYWQSAATAGPFLLRVPVVKWPEEFNDEEEEGVEDQAGEEMMSLRESHKEPKVFSEVSKGLACGCNGVCTCVIAAVRAMNDSQDVLNQEIEAAMPIAVEGAAKDVATAENLAIMNNSTEDTSENQQEEYEHLRQLFITKNAVLCHEVKKNFRELSHACPDAKQHLDFEDTPLPSKLDNVNAFSFPLFLSSREWLLLLDASLPGEPFFPRDEAGDLLVSVPGWGESDTHLSFLPSLDSDAEDFDSDDDFEADKEHEAAADSKIYEGGAMREITYSVFVHEIWRQMLKKQNVTYHPSLVWTEIRSFIKGSVETLLTPSGYLSFEDYNELGRKRAPNFSGDRRTVYEMFQIYEKIKTQRQLFDESDVLFQVYQRLRDVIVPEWTFHEIYVDETQDFTQAELFTLIRCCRNPNTMFFTGDTAQSIMRGVAFRFSDLKTLFYSTKQALKSMKVMTKIGIPRRIYQLTHNYRSHKGILNLAASVIDILGHFFPESFDQLDRDVGLFDGPRPVILETSNFGDLAVLLRGTRRKTSVIEFGAHQVVLVANEESKENLPEELSYALVLSIYEAKGLEFDDVLLYNFFKDSQARKEWRVITTYLNSILDSIGGPTMTCGTGLISREEDDLQFASRPLEFDSTKHKILNSELKQLYTALTRARVNVWIYDEDLENRAPMFDYFMRRGLVELVKLDGITGPKDSMERMFAEKSTKEDWDSRGLYFYEKELWQVALKCYEKSGNEIMLKKCCAHVQAVKAYEMATAWKDRRIGTLKEIHSEYLRAANMYLESDLPDEAVICLKNSKEWEIVGDLCRKLQRFEEAGKYYSRGGRLVESVDCFKKAKDYFSATDVMYRSKKLMECIELLKEYQKLVAENKAHGIRPPRSTLTLDRVCAEAAEEYFRKKDLTTLHEVLRLMPSVEAQLQYAESKGYTDLMIDILVENERGEDAALMLMQRGRYIQAVKCTSQKKTAAVCYLENAGILFERFLLDEKKGCFENNELDELIVSSLERCIEISSEADCDTCDTALVLGDAFYMMSVVKNDTDYTKKALQSYEKTKNVVGMFMCYLCLYEEDKDISDKLIKVLGQVLEVVSTLLLTRRFTSTEQNLVVTCAQHLGYECLINKGILNEFKVVNRKRLFAVFSCLTIDSTSAFNSMGTSNAFEDVTGERSYMASLLFERVFQFLVKLRGCLEREYKHRLPCERFLSGFSHRQEQCGLQHVRPTRERFQVACDPLLKLIWLDSISRNFLSKVGNFKKRKMDEYFQDLLQRIFRSFTTSNTCDTLYRFILQHTRYLSSTTFKGGELANVLRNANSAVRTHVDWYLKMLAKEENEEYLLSDVNLFLKMSLMANAIGLDPPQSEIVVRGLREKMQAKYQDPNAIIPRNIGVVFNKEQQIELFHESYISSLFLAHKKKNIIGATHHILRRFYPKIITKYKDLALPTLQNSTIVLEVHLSLCLLGLCKISPNANPRVFLPEFYIQNARFFSSLYALSHKGSSDALNAVALIKDSTNANVFLNQLKVFVELICATKFEKFDMFTAALKEAKSGHYEYFERFLILVLVLIGSSHPLLILEIVKPLARCLKAKIPILVAQKDDFPERLISALVKFESAEKGVDVLYVLEDLLKDSGTEFVECCWKRDLNKLWFQSRAERRNNPRRLMRGRSGVYQQERRLNTDSKDRTARPVDKTLVTPVPVNDTKTSADTSSPNRDTAEEGNIFKEDYGAPSSDVNFQDTAPEDDKALENSDEALTQDKFEIETLGVTEDEEQALEIAPLDAQEFIDSNADNAARIIQRWYRGHRLLRRLRQKSAARVIQRWFRKLVRKREESESTNISDEQKTPDLKEEDESKGESKYVDYSGCRVCGISFHHQADKNTTAQGETYEAHLSQNSSHWNTVIDYENFMMYLESSVQPSLVNAEKLIEKVDLLSEQGRIPANHRKVVSVHENRRQVDQIKRDIFRNHQWDRQEELQGWQERLHQSCFNLQKQITRLEQKGSWRSNQGRYDDRGYDHDNDYFQDTRKRGGGRYHKQGLRGRGNHNRQQNR